MPSVFTWPDVVAMTDQPWQPTLAYPARGIGTLWPPGPRRRPGALRDLPGASRSALLHALDAEAFTTALARRVGLGLPTTSVHLRVLRDA
jgi:DNA-binding transcriptional ArsR family regulator